ncbi:hypothetical protein Tco_1577379 [Tanacetum coccineum]
MENSSDQEQDGKDKSVKSSSLIGSLMPRGLKEAQEMMIFALDHSHNKHKGHIKDCQLGNPFKLLEGEPVMEGLSRTFTGLFLICQSCRKAL